jgi:hypothetical protein
VARKLSEKKTSKKGKEPFFALSNAQVWVIKNRLTITGLEKFEQKLPAKEKGQEHGPSIAYRPYT